MAPRIQRAGSFNRKQMDLFQSQSHEESAGPGFARQPDVGRDDVGRD